MVNFWDWIKPETIGVVGGLIFTGATIRQEAKARETQNLLAYTERHRSLWTEVAQRPELQRIICEKADLPANPITPAEEVTLNVILVHYEMGWRLAKSMDRGDLKPLARDVRKFFTLPLPNAAWTKTKNERNREFVKFVERALAQSDTGI